MHGEPDPHEADETFTVDLSRRSNGASSMAPGSGHHPRTTTRSPTSDRRPVGHGGTTPVRRRCTFNVTLSNPSDQTVTVDYDDHRRHGDDRQDSDYDAAAERPVYLRPGSDRRRPSTSPSTAIATHESDESFTVDLVQPVERERPGRFRAPAPSSTTTPRPRSRSRTRGVTEGNVGDHDRFPSTSRLSVGIGRHRHRRLHPRRTARRPWRTATMTPRPTRSLSIQVRPRRPSTSPFTATRPMRPTKG